MKKVNVEKSSMFIALLILSATLISCTSSYETTRIIEPNDSTNYNATYILPIF